jgi:hypothetical protein
MKSMSKIKHLIWKNYKITKLKNYKMNKNKNKNLSINMKKIKIKLNKIK